MTNQIRNQKLETDVAHLFYHSVIRISNLIRHSNFEFLIFFCLLAGCIPSQQHDVAVYRKMIDGGKPAPVQIAPDRVVTLTDALKLAIQNEEQLSMQGENYLQALLAKDKAFADFLPTISVSANWTYQSQNGAAAIQQSQIGNIGKVATQQQFTSVAAPLQWNLFNGFRDYYTMKSATQTIEQQKQLIFDLEQTILLDVAQDYYAVLTNEQSVQVLDTSYQAQDANVRVLEHQYAVGAARKLDVTQAQSQASATRVTLLQAQASVRTSRAMLVYLVDAPILNNPLRDDFEPPPTDLSENDWIEIAENTRQDLLAANAAVRAARYNVEVAFGQYYPTVALNTNWNFFSQVWTPTVWSNILNVNMPIFTGGLIRAEVRQAWSEFRVAALTQAQLRREIEQNIRVAYADLELAHNELAELTVEVNAARDQLYLAQLLYKNGGGTYLNVIDAQATLLSTQLQLTSEQFTQKTAYFNLLRTAGRLSYVAMTSATRPSQAALTSLATQPVTQPTTRP